ncbi:hypothetical protein ACLB2K_004041 [Fragaria x ananassa]
METRQPEEQISKWKKKLKMQDYFVVNLVRTGGGLALLWDVLVSVSVVDFSPNFIDTVVTFLSEDFVCQITFMYGNPHDNEKKAFWHSTYTCFNPRSSSWLCVGDFNEIQWSFEKWGGTPPDIWRIKLFRSSNAQLRELNFQGPEFTWFAMRNQRVYIKERLDRARANVEWCSNQTRTQVFHLPKVGSYHRPILVDTLPSEIKGKPLFRYEQF